MVNNPETQYRIGQVLGGLQILLLLANLVVGVVLILDGKWAGGGFCLAVTMLLMFLVFHGTLNVFQSVWFIYWAYRDVDRGWYVRKAFAKETDFPWRYGKGIQVGVGPRSLQIGFCRRLRLKEGEDGLLVMMNGRELPFTPEEIGEWQK